MKKIEDDVAIPLIARYRLGDRKAGDELIRMCDGVVMHWASRTQRRRTRIDLDDAIQCGRMGVLRAADTWEDGRGRIFRTHVYVCVRWEIHAEVCRRACLVRPGSPGLMSYIFAAISRGLEREDAISYILEHIPMNRPTLEHAYNVVRKACRVVEPDDSSKSVSYESSIHDELDIQHVNKLVRNEAANNREYELAVRMLDEEPALFRQLAARWGVSKQRVQQLDKAFKARVAKRIREEMAA